MKYWLAGEKIWFIEKKLKYKGQKVEKRGERGKFSLYLGEKISFLKKGVGQNYLILGKYTPFWIYQVIELHILQNHV